MGVSIILRKNKDLLFIEGAKASHLNGNIVDICVELPQVDFFGGVELFSLQEIESNEILFQVKLYSIALEVLLNSVIYYIVFLGLMQ